MTDDCFHASSVFFHAKCVCARDQKKGTLG